MREIANECKGPLFHYLGHFCNPEFLREGHNMGLMGGSGGQTGQQYTTLAGEGNVNPYGMMEAMPTPVEQPYKPAIR